MRSRAALCALGALGALSCAKAPPPPPTALPERPALAKTLLAEVRGVGPITGMALDPEQPGALVAAGRLGAALVRLDGAQRTFVSFSEPPDGPVLPVFDSHGSLFFLDRGGPGGAGHGRAGLYDFDGRRVFSHRGEEGAQDLAAGDLDGDGRLDLVAALRQGGGVRRLDAEGGVVWSRPDADVRQVALADLDGDRRPEILHGTRQGRLVVRDAQGRAVRSFPTSASPLGRFAVVSWPERDTPRVAWHLRGTLLVAEPTREVSTSLPAPVWNGDGRMAAAAFEPRRGGERWLAILDTLRDAGPAVLSLYDAKGRLLHAEVLDEACGALAAVPVRGGRSDLVLGCDERVYRYSLSSPQRTEPVLPVSLALVRGDAFGPLRFGDPPERVRGLRALLPGHRCRTSACDTSYVELAGRSFVLSTEFADGGLERVSLFALPATAESYAAEARADWRALVGVASGALGPADAGAGDFPAAAAVESAPASSGWRVARTHVWRRDGREVEIGVATEDARGPLQYAAYAIFARPSDPALAIVPAKPAPTR